jgi:transposase InsO family protein
MQVFGLPRRVIRSARAASRLLAAQPSNSEAARRRDAVARWLKARADGLTSERAAAAVGTPLSTLKRWEKDPRPKSRRPKRVRKPDRPPGLVAEIERLRADFSTWGKAKIGPVLRRSGFTVSDSAVGRVLSAMIARGRVLSVRDILRKHGPRSAPKTRAYAVRKPKDLVFERPGDVVQIDTLSIAILPGQGIKQFTAYDPAAKWTVAKPYKRATARNAADFLKRVRAQMPDPIKAIQIDGGSEFMAEFETACRDAGLPLYVLPPRSPKLNGAVERCNGAWRYEFYACNDLPLDIDKLAQRVDAFQHLYNNHRPHGALAGLTPAQYLSQRRARESPKAHMS